jgi:hypothetical protein
MKNVVMYFAICVTFISCLKIDDISDGEKILVDTKCPSIFPFTDFMKVEKVIELESKEDALIAGILDVKVRDKRIFIFAEKSKFYVFNQDGKYLNSIGKKGNGPNEFNYPFDFDLSPDGEKVAIWDYINSKLLFYKIDGQFIDGIRSKEIRRGFKFCWIHDNRFLLSSLYRSQNNTGERFQLYLTDENLNVIKGCIPYDKQFEGLRCDNTIFQKYHNGLIYFRHPIEGEVYQFIDNDFKSKYSISFGDYDLPNERKKEYIDNVSLYAKDAMYSKYAILHGFYELKDWYYLWYNFNGKVYSQCINKINRKQVRYTHASPFDYLSDIKIAGIYNDHLIAFIEPYSIKEKLLKITEQQRLKYKKGIEFWEGIIKNKSDDDNPLLVYLKPQNY